MEILGIDIGGTGIKGAPVRIDKGTLVRARHRLLTPKPATPVAVAKTVSDLVKHFKWKGPIGCAFPAVIKKGKAYSASNVDKGWVGTDGESLLKSKTRCPVILLNDADAAGIAEMEFGAGKGKKGVVILVTLGTGIGTALFVDGKLVPNTELGHIEVRGKDAERRASDSARQRKNLNWKEWAKKVDEYLNRLEALISPDLFIIGGGVSKKHARFIPLLTTKAKVVPAKMLNEAGIIGAALAARGLK